MMTSPWPRPMMRSAPRRCLSSIRKGWSNIMGATMTIGRRPVRSEKDFSKRPLMKSWREKRFHSPLPMRWGVRSSGGTSKSQHGLVSGGREEKDQWPGDKDPDRKKKAPQAREDHG